MKTIYSIIIITGCFLFLPPSITSAQEEDWEFKFIPPYPEGYVDSLPIPTPVYIPKIVYPNDPKLQGKEGRVYVKMLVDRKGLVSEAQVLKTTDTLFNKYAIKYAKQYRFKWNNGWPEGLKNQKNVWLAIIINFKHVD